MSPRRFKNLNKTARKNMVAMGVFITAIVLVAAGGTAWGLLNRRAFFLPALQRSRCVRNLELIAKAKAEFRQEHDLTNGAPVAAEQLVDYVPDGWNNLRCPGRGTYTIRPVGQPPECSAPGHAPKANLDEPRDGG
ncbi:MAG: hypothetical protein V1873_00715 [Verrucomicrobiota bacterium]